MRIGINVPNELYERFKPLTPTYNLSQVCRDAIKSRIESYETAERQAQEDGMETLANRFLQEYVKKTVLDWEAIGRENARNILKLGVLMNISSKNGQVQLLN